MHNAIFNDIPFYLLETAKCTIKSTRPSDDLKNS